jgi:hypothetical protein
MLSQSANNLMPNSRQRTFFEIGSLIYIKIRLHLTEIAVALKLESEMAHLFVTWFYWY